MIVYKITFPNKKLYIGITSLPLSQRKSKHYYRVRKGSTLPVHNALRKYSGKEEWETIDSSADNYETLKELEIKYIKEYDTLRKGLNCTIGGDGTIGFKMSEKRKQEISDFFKGKPPWNKGISGKITFSKKSKQKMSKSRKSYIEKHDIASIFNVYEAIIITKATGRRKAIYKRGRFLGTYKNQNEFSKEFGIPASNINKALKGLRPQAGGFIFQYKEELCRK